LSGLITKSSQSGSLPSKKVVLSSETKKSSVFRQCSTSFSLQSAQLQQSPQRRSSCPAAYTRDRFQGPNTRPTTPWHPIQDIVCCILPATQLQLHCPSTYKTHVSWRTKKRQQVFTNVWPQAVADSLTATVGVFLCWCPLLPLTPLQIQTQMYATGAHVWYHSRSKGAPLLETVMGPSPSGPVFLHIQYQGTGDKVVDHTEGCGPYSTQVMPVGGSTSCISSSPHHSASSSNHQPVPESPAEHVQQSKVLLTYKTNFHACAWGAKIT
jgi:hypothetical protein